jgi:hypothetical protein
LQAVFLFLCNYSIVNFIILSGKWMCYATF